MKILLLTPQLPYPPRQGTTIRNFNLLRLLARRHTVDLFTFLAPGEALTRESPLHQLCRRIVCVEQPPRPTWRRAQETLLSPLPDMALRLASRAAHTRMTSLVQAAVAEGAPYHLVQAEGIEMGGYGLQAVT
ncbi:MAG: glycosyl transferase family 1, partial [Caldilineae bacterium]